MKLSDMKWGIVLLSLTLVHLKADAIELVLPTENDHLFTGQLDRFYMYVDRTFEGEVTKPWEGGSFGFVRTPLRVNGEVVLTKFHEGIDIAPIKRDKAGNPLDLVMSISGGKWFTPVCLLGAVTMVVTWWLNMIGNKPKFTRSMRI